MDDVDDFLADLARWSADERSNDAARTRMRERWLRQQAMEDARFAGVALDLAERRAAVTVRTTTGRTLNGRIEAVGRDFWLIRPEGGTGTFVALAAVATVRPDPGQRAVEADSERTAAVDTALADVLAALAGDRPRVRLALEGGGDAVTGELRAAGGDVATLRLDGEPPATVYVHLSSVRELSLVG